MDVDPLSSSRLASYKGDGSADDIWNVSVNVLGPNLTGVLSNVTAGVSYTIDSGVLNGTLGNSNSTGSGSGPAEVDVEQILASALGARHRILAESIIWTVVYALIFVTGLVGNICTCIVISKNHYMHTATNYYLFSLAISDVLTLILGLPPEVYAIWEAYPWVFGEPFCIFKTLLSETTSSASVLTITAFTMERYLAICHPIRAQTMSSLSRAVKIIIFIWVAACVCSLLYPIYTRTYYAVPHPVTGEPIPDSLQCNIPGKWLDSTIKYMLLVTTIVLFVVPMTIITVLYVLIGVTLRRSGLSRQSSDNPSPTAGTANGQSSSRRAVLKMLVAVVVAFFICWAPFHAQRLMTALYDKHKWSDALLEIQTFLYYISGVLYFVSSTVNPILYNLMSKKYRQAFKMTLCRCRMTPEERMHIRNGRGRFYSERSTTVVSTAVGTSARLLGQDRDLAMRMPSPQVTKAFINCSDSRVNNKSKSTKGTQRLLTKANRNGASKYPRSTPTSRSINGSVNCDRSMGSFSPNVASTSRKHGKKIKKKQCPEEMPLQCKITLPDMKEKSETFL